MQSDATLKIAIVGAGPAGFYTAEAVAAACPNAEISIIERLPTPYGLIRSGVAPDHQTTKRIQDTFEAIACLPQVNFLGNVEIGRDVSLQSLREIYDAVVLSCGVPDDVPLDIPGAALPGVYGASKFVGWYNGHPDHAMLNPLLDQPGAVVIGNGNVAIDIARILSKSQSELAGSDIAAHAMHKIGTFPAGDVVIAGRRGALDSKFTPIELAELGELEQAVAVADQDQLAEEADERLPPRERRVKAKILECLKEFAKADPERLPRRIRFQFNARPIEIIGDDRVKAIRFESTILEEGRLRGTGKVFDIPCGLVISAIGYRARALEGLAVAPAGNSLLNENGQIEPALYVAGWLRRGPSGKIGTNRGDGELVANRIREEVRAAGRPGYSALRALLINGGTRATTFSDWKCIEQAERMGEASRISKITSVADMLELCSDDIRRPLTAVDREVA